MMDIPAGYKPWSCEVCTATCNFEAMMLCRGNTPEGNCGFDTDKPESLGGIYEFIKMKPIAASLKSFLESPLRNEWIGDDTIKVYVRKSRRNIEGQMIDCLDIATVEVEEEERGKGIFTDFLKDAIALNSFTCIFIENVQQDWFAQFFMRQGFKRDPRHMEDCCLYLIDNSSPAKL